MQLTKGWNDFSLSSTLQWQTLIESPPKPKEAVLSEAGDSLSGLPRWYRGRLLLVWRMYNSCHPEITSMHSTQKKITLIRLKSYNRSGPFAVDKGRKGLESNCRHLATSLKNSVLAHTCWIPALHILPLFPNPHHQGVCALEKFSSSQENFIIYAIVWKNAGIIIIKIKTSIKVDKEDIFYFPCT